jgi:asparagine synthetase B (glutamine-hydrolysing)
MHFSITLTGVAANFIAHRQVDNNGFKLCTVGVGCTVLIDRHGKEILKLVNGEIQVAVDCRIPIFIASASHGTFVVSSQLAILVALTKRRQELDFDYILDYIAAGPFPTSSTVFKGVCFLAARDKYDLRLSKVVARSDLMLDADSRVKGLGILELVEGFLAENLPERTTIGLEFSGGLESSILLHALMRIGSESVKLYHLADPLSASSEDTEHVKRVSEKYKCDLTILNYDSADICNGARSSMLLPNFPHTALVNMSYVDFAATMVKDDNTVFVNGSGGDALFCAHPPREVFYELVKQKRFIQCLRTLSDLSVYYRCPPAKLLKTSAKSYQLLLDKLNNPKQAFSESYRAQELLKHKYNPQLSTRESASRWELGKEPTTHRDRRFSADVNNYEILTSTLSSFPNRYLAPFLSRGVISAGLRVPTAHLLKGSKDRYYLRRAAYERYKDERFWETRKGSVMGLTQRAFQANKAAILETIMSGPAGLSQMIVPERVEHLVHGVSVGAIACPASLIHLYSVNIFLKHWEGAYVA